MVWTFIECCKNAERVKGENAMQFSHVAFSSITFSITWFNIEKNIRCHLFWLPRSSQCYIKAADCHVFKTKG